MKVISKGLRAKNIRIHCPACFAVYELEDKNDFKIH